MTATLRKRWESPEGQERAEEAFARLLAGRPLSGMDLGTVGGRIDLRGLSVPIPRRLRRFETAGWFVEELGGLVKFQNARLENLDLSGAQLQSLRFHDSQVAGCLFDGANCQDWRLWGTEVTDCGFAKANLRQAAVGTWHNGRRNAWRRVDFSNADFRVISISAARYEDCDFSDAKLAKVRFGQCALTRCRFSGALHETVFDGRELSDVPAPPPPEDVDFGEAVFDQVEFMGFDLSRVILPRDPDVRLVRRYRCVAERVLAAVRSGDSLEARMIRAEFAHRLKMMRGSDEYNVFNRRDYLAAGGDELAELADHLVSQAEAACLT
jgi:uncharacterized protein YjbI with pentapeptide repeats